MLNDRETKVGRIFLRLTDLPSLPRVVEKLLALPTATATTRQFADLIAKDQGLAAKVLRLVNSAFYSLRVPISSIRQASALLGVRTLKSLALSVSVINIFKRRLPHFDPIHFWRHSLATALASNRLAERLDLGLGDEVYIAGLLHDVGVALLAQHYPQEFEKLALPGTEGTPEALRREVEEFGQTHAEAGYILATLWRLPALVGLGLRHHHTPMTQLPTDLPPQAPSLIEVVQLADRFARRSGYSFGEMDRLDPAEPLPTAETLNLPPELLPETLGDLERTIAEFEHVHFEAPAAEPSHTSGGSTGAGP